MLHLAGFLVRLMPIVLFALGLWYVFASAHSGLVELANTIGHAGKGY